MGLSAGQSAGTPGGRVVVVVLPGWVVGGDPGVVGAAVGVVVEDEEPVPVPVVPGVPEVGVEALAAPGGAGADPPVGPTTMVS